MNGQLLLSMNPALRRLLADPSISDDLRLAAVEVAQNELRGQLGKLASLPPGGAAVMGQMMRATYARTTTRLADGTVGYYERGTRTDDCWAAAVATCLQVPLDEVPDPRLDERVQAGEDPDGINRSAWAEFDRWLGEGGLSMTVHRKVPAPRRRWIGIVKFPGLFMAHCLVMSRDEVLFDPVDRTRHERKVRTYSPADVSYGYSFSKVTKRREI